MIIKNIPASSMDNRNYLLIDEDTKKAVLIDASESPEQVEKNIDETGAKVEYILLTHGHFDHVLGINRLKEKTGAKVLVHENDAFMLTNINEVMQTFGMGPYEVPQYDETIKDGDIIRFGNKEIKTLHTPGHTEGCVCFLVDGKVFSGDTLFRECVGRTDLPGGDFDKMVASIKKLFLFNDETEVFPGHGEPTTIAYEKQFNEIKRYIK